MSEELATKTDLTVAIAASETRLLERIEKVETTLLTEFHKYAQATEHRMLVAEVMSHSLSDRMAAIETRVRELERRL